MTRIHITVNGRQVEAEVAPRTHLADFLREQLFLTGTHIGCEHGICGACTVEIDGDIARSCITYAVACDGASVRTIEGFDDDAAMARLREAFTRHHALQCGYCTPGMLIAARDLIGRKRGLTRAEIRAEMSGNLCRCTGYMGIVGAIESVMAEAGSADRAARLAERGTWLGPAPGPGAMPPATAVAASSRQPVVATPKPSVAMASNRPPITMTVGAIVQVEGETRLTQSFVLPHAREAVWALMADPEAVARCMPGMTLDGPSQDGRLRGRLEIALGPIKASFAGEGTVDSMPEAYRQVIAGAGGDRRSGSRASGSIDYCLVALAPNATRVDVTISYMLSGPLAQIGRPAIVRDLVRRVGEAFAQNVDGVLSGQVVTAGRSLNAFALFLQLLFDRIRAGVAWALGGRG